jgi:NAD(P)-dependent dehydrogenase (short-subunit alcohol dehydrogenase family)
MSGATDMRAGSVAAVTGGANGIGAACCRKLAMRGMVVVVLDRDEAQAKALAVEIKGHARTIDVTDESKVDACAEAIEQAIGPVDVLVNSAGIFQVPLPPESLPMAAWDDVVRVDQRGTYVTSVAFGRRMARRGRGVIINIASITGMRSVPLHAYAPAKAAVIAMTECLAAEWGRSGVRVNAISPGYTRTAALQAAIDRGERDVSALIDNAALGRMVEPDEIASAVAFLASDDAGAITGVNLPVDCGWLVAPSWHTYGGIRPARR